jgi:hypothetical protein
MPNTSKNGVDEINAGVQKHPLEIQPKHGLIGPSQNGISQQSEQIAKLTNE